MKNSKSKFIMPVMAIAFAVAGAFATNVERTSQDVVKGYTYDLNSQICSITEVNCSTIPGEICTTNMNEPLFQIDFSGTSCPQELYRLE